MAIAAGVHLPCLEALTVQGSDNCAVARDHSNGCCNSQHVPALFGRGRFPTRVRL
eukprot:NODE_33371_length_297_cov_24.311765.p3 GENE.NODE_33371_length_297_cov_24.311765~~NODE_33371_length_297_cov_24.311765.p3  ORF type:complete len:55 (-),score=0.50 NODE_33371_length_297_cov_24.311765:133-297(-)